MNITALLGLIVKYGGTLATIASNVTELTDILSAAKDEDRDELTVDEINKVNQIVRDSENSYLDTLRDAQEELNSGA